MERLRRQGHKLPFSRRKLGSRAVLSYIFDYIIIVILVALFAIIDKIEPFKQHFSLRNYTLQYPFAEHERIPVPWLLVIVVAFPAGVIGFYTLVVDGLFTNDEHYASANRLRKWSGRYTLKDRLWELNCGILGLLLAVGAAFTITGTFKNAIGKPRPDVIDRCQIKDGSADGEPFGLSDPRKICTQTNLAILNDGFKSFPSGHSSTAFAGLSYLSLYLGGKLRVLDSRGEVWKTFLVLLPILAAGLVAGSRIMDARHHPFDVISGMALGILVAWASYRQYFPPVTQPWRKGRAYPIRSWGRPHMAPEHVVDKDEEPYADRGIYGANDVELRATGPPSSLPTTAEGSANPNVFRAQVSASQRARDRDASETRRRFQAQHGAEGWDSDTTSSSSGPRDEEGLTSAPRRSGLGPGDVTVPARAVSPFEAGAQGHYGQTTALGMGGDTAYHSPLRDG